MSRFTYILGPNVLALALTGLAFGSEVSPLGERESISYYPEAARGDFIMRVDSFRGLQVEWKGMPVLTEAGLLCASPYTTRPYGLSSGAYAFEERKSVTKAPVRVVTRGDAVTFFGEAIVGSKINLSTRPVPVGSSPIYVLNWRLDPGQFTKRLKVIDVRLAEKASP